MNELKIGIVVADDEEYKPLATTIEKGQYESYNFLGRRGHKFFITTEKGRAEVYSILCGIGKVNAATVAAHFATIGCNIILNYGLSGGISGVSKNDLVLCTGFLEHDFDLTGIGYKPCEKPNQEYVYSSSEELNNIFKKIVPNIKGGTAVCGDRFICDKETRDFFKNNYNATSCDMETAAIAYVCAFGDIPFLALRRISDDAGDDAYESYTEMNNLAESVLSDLILVFIKEIINSGFKA